MYVMSFDAAFTAAMHKITFVSDRCAAITNAQATMLHAYIYACSICRRQSFEYRHTRYSMIATDPSALPRDELSVGVTEPASFALRGCDQRSSRNCTPAIRNGATASNDISMVISPFCADFTCIANELSGATRTPISESGPMSAKIC